MRSLTTFILPFVRPAGRLPRLEFWRAVALLGIALLGAFFAAGLVGVLYGVQDVTIGIVVFAVLAVGTLSGLFLAAQRLHDRGRHGWWALLALLPIAGQVWFVWNGIEPGRPGANRWGPDAGTGMSAADVFGDGPVPQVGRKPPVASTIVAWTVLLLFAIILIVALFQSPQQRTSGRTASEIAKDIFVSRSA